MAQSVLWKLYSHSLAVDVILKVDGDEREIKAHRCILMGASEYFEVNLTNENKDRDSNVTILKEMRFETLKTIIDYIYSGGLILHCSLLEAFVAADYLKIKCVLSELNYEARDATVKDCIEVYEAHKYLDAESKELVVNLIRKNLWELMSTGEFAALDVDQLLDILTNPSSVHLSQRDHVIAINVWVLAAPEDRYAHVSRLLSTVHLSTKMELKFIMERIAPICKRTESQNILLALVARSNGYTGEFVEQIIGSKNTI